MQKGSLWAGKAGRQRVARRSGMELSERVGEIRRAYDQIQT